jgi:hypothetical protein
MGKWVSGELLRGQQAGGCASVRRTHGQRAYSGEQAAAGDGRVSGERANGQWRARVGE